MVAYADRWKLWKNILDLNRHLIIQCQNWFCFLIQFSRYRFVWSFGIKYLYYRPFGDIWYTWNDQILELSAKLNQLPICILLTDKSVVQLHWSEHTKLPFLLLILFAAMNRFDESKALLSLLFWHFTEQQKEGKYHEQMNHININAWLPSKQ